VKDEKGNTPLFMACRYGAHDILECLLKLGCNIDQRNPKGQTALMRSVAIGRERCVESLVYASANIEVKDNFGRSALYYGMKKMKYIKWQRIVGMLKGQKWHFGMAPGKENTMLEELKIAASGGFLAQFFDVNEVQHSLVTEFLSSAVTVGSLENLLQTLYFGGDIDHVCGTGKAIHFAAAHGTSATARVLLSARAAVDGRDDFGLSPLEIASEYGKLEVIRTLVEANAALNVGFEEHSPLIIAAMHGKLESISVLLQANADVNFKTPKGTSALFHSIHKGAIDSVTLLLERQADVNAKLLYGTSPLWTAVVYGNAIIVAELLKFDANVHEKIGGVGICEWAEKNEVDRENILNVLKDNLSLRKHNQE